ncbi:glutaredoxin-like protein NrdH [Gleimia sp. 6138-11-ORH1]|uniref:glutaredoxin-like protein NrdH n=1 Tax=Gleimia sp. 6138-11-ORH1 TaxID=2973937 RepID=UPI002168CC53|nr:glutaredoxin-like protein NrdH [Gleimia sp. 6138-11-ORH1]MCS4485103.1 glutaredoxin-like protein NrdH [Gleimia sp. 6138-11-ORH1]
MTITVYSKPQCVQCDATKRALKKQGLDFEVIDMSLDLEALEFVKGLGYVQAPVVMAGDEHWSGYRPDLIKQIAQAAAAVANG